MEEVGAEFVDVLGDGVGRSVGGDEYEVEGKYASGIVLVGPEVVGQLFFGAQFVEEGLLDVVHQQHEGVVRELAVCSK